MEDGKVYWPWGEVEKLKWYNIAQIHVTGNDQNDHHGGKHSLCSGCDTLRYVDHAWEGERLDIRLRDEAIEAVYHYQFYADIKAVRVWVSVTNVESAPVGLEYVASLSLTGLTGERVYIPHNAWCEEVNWKTYTPEQLGLCPQNRFSTKRITIGNTGAWSTKEYLPMGALEGEQSYLWQIEHNGSWQWEISTLGERLYLQLSGPTEREHGWYSRLVSGESFESVAAVLTVADDFNGALAEMTAYRRRRLDRPAADAGLPVIFNDYMNCLMGNPTAEKEFPMIDRAAALGAEYYVMDAGWYADGSWWDTVGEWLPCDWRFPNGIKEVFDYVRTKGMIPGIWLEIEVMGVHCPILDRFDDRCFFMRHGKRVVDHGRYQLDFRHPKVRDFATAVIDRVVGEYGVGYIKMDYNIEPGAGTEVDADSFGDGLLGHNRALLAWIDGIRARYPDLILENCSSGGMRMEYATLSHYALQSVSDQTDYRKTAHIAAAAATAVVPEQAAIWSYPKAGEGDAAVVMNMVNALPLRMHLSGQIGDMSKEQMARVREGVDCYKAIRSHIAAAVPFYPCGLPDHEDDIFCAGYRGERTYLAVWRLDTPVEALEIPIDGRTARVIYGDAQLDGDGQSLCVTMPGRNSAVMIEL